MLLVSMLLASKEDIAVSLAMLVDSIRGVVGSMPVERASPEVVLLLDWAEAKMPAKMTMTAETRIFTEK